MRVLIDTDVCLDLLSGREPFVEDAIGVFSTLAGSGATCCVSAISFRDIHYFLGKQENGAAIARASLERFKAEVEILAVDDKVIIRALRSRVTDFEDAIQAEAAEMAKVDLIVSRNVKDYKNSAITAITPKVFLATRRSPFST